MQQLTYGHHRQAGDYQALMAAPKDIAITGRSAKGPNAPTGQATEQLIQQCEAAADQVLRILATGIVVVIIATSVIHIAIG